MTLASNPAIPDLPFEQHRLANGLRVVLQPDSRLPLVAVNLWYHVGSRNERPDKTGLAHLFEHMLFQGSAHVGTNDHFRLVQQVGGVANGSTWYDRTNYYETLPAHALDLGLWLEADRMGFLLDALTDDKLENQRSVVRNERKQRVDNAPYGRASEVLFAALYSNGHPYGWPVIGTDDDIRDATREDVEDFFRRHYAPHNAVLSLVGDFEPAHALERVAAYFAELPASGLEAAPVVPELPQPAAARRIVLRDRVGLERLYLGFVVPPFGSREWLALAFLIEALGGGKSSPLEQDLVHRSQLARDVSVYLYPTEWAATLLVVATARPESSAAEIEARVLEHLERAGRETFSASDSARARRRFLASGLADFEAVDRRAELLSQGATYFDDPAHSHRELEIYARLDPDEARAIGERWLHPDRRVAVHVLPDTHTKTDEVSA